MLRLTTVLLLINVAHGVLLCEEVANEAHRVACIAKYAPVVVGVTAELDGYFHEGGVVGPAAFVRLAWHSAGTFNSAVKPSGGTNGGCIRMDPERSDPSNAGLSEALFYVSKLVARFPFVSFADMTQIVAAIIHEERGSNELPFTPGRRDFHEAAAEERCAPNRLPPKFVAPDNSSASMEPLMESIFFKFAKYFPSEDTTPEDGVYSEGFVEKLVAAMGGHALGGMHYDNSGASGRFTAAPDVFDNEYYRNLVELPWTRYENESNGDVVFSSGALMLLASDIAMLYNAQTKAVVETFAQNNTAFLEVYTKSWAELVQNGLPQYSAEDSNCPFTDKNRTHFLCNPSNIMRDHHQTYNCEVPTGLSGLSIHWTHESTTGVVDIALVDAVGLGWLGIAFPENPNTMTPANNAVITHDGGTSAYMITGRTMSEVVPLPEVGGALLGPLFFEESNGNRIVRLKMNLTGLFDAHRLPVIVARDLVSTSLQKHLPTQSKGLTINLIDGNAEEASAVQDYRRRHAVLMVVALACFVLAVLAKRYAKPVFRISNSSVYPYGPGFVCHILFVLLGTSFMAAGITIAAKDLSSHGAEADKTGHRVSGYITLAVMCITIILGILRVGRASKLGGIIHRFCGLSTLICIAIQCSTGMKALQRTASDCVEVTVLFYVVIITGTILVVVLEAAKRRSSAVLREVTLNKVKCCTPDTPYYSLQEVASHNTLRDPWLILEGKVYDLGSFPARHPGGVATIENALGRDATTAFFTIAHSTSAMQQMKQFFVGYVEGEDVREYIQLAEDIAAALVELDTDEAERLLCTAEMRSDSGLPQSLILAFRDLLKNLSSFKPYLPSAVLQALTERKGVDEGDDMLPDFAAEDPTVYEVQKLRARRKKRVRSHSNGSSRDGTVSHPTPTLPGQYVECEEGGHRSETGSTTHFSSTVYTHAHPPLDLSNEMNGYRKVVALVVRSHLSQETLTTYDGGAGMHSEMLAHCYREVEAMRGCVHRVTEGGFTATWGAVGSIPFSAAIFKALKVASSLGTEGYHCGVSSAMSNVCLLGPAAGRTFQILGGVIQDADALARVAQACGAPVVVSATTLQSFKSLSSFFIHAPFLDVVGCAGRDHPIQTEVVLEAKATAETSKEWMYELQQIKEDTVEGIEKVLQTLFKPDMSPEASAGLTSGGGRDVTTIAATLERCLAVSPRGATLGSWMCGVLTSLISRPTLEISIAGSVYPVGSESLSILHKGCLFGGRVPDTVIVSIGR